MKISIELSFYPLQDDYKAEIRALIARLQQQTEISCNTNTMSTQLYGDYDQVMHILHKELKRSLQAIPAGVVSMKLFNQNLDPRLL